MVTGVTMTFSAQIKTVLESSFFTLWIRFFISTTNVSLVKMDLKKSPFPVLKEESSGNFKLKFLLEPIIKSEVTTK